MSKIIFITLSMILVAVIAAQCPDGKSSCPSGSTCCSLTSGGYGCCPYENATCCSDHQHCCPGGYTCDLSQGECKKQSDEPKVVVHKMHVHADSEGDVQCPDGKSQCPTGSTCCQLTSGGYGCCPYVNASCCSDHQHCCPGGYTCDLSQGECKKQSGEFESIPFGKKFNAKILDDDEDKSEDAQCPDGKSSCPTGSTCCQLTSGGYGCCPYVNATCCSDHQHCCPGGYTCDLAQGECKKQSANSFLLLPTMGLKKARKN
eukprot:TRINITY_DN2_c0_g1_i1.p2 TRINITY_DN2_c0_g1~~TRINITY_DN2_c0_g1_i1.p2  ORF type:complete len:277 (+),score=48.23 TRINITY_DN2_c0_g1_i1:56-832(+)